MTTEETTYEATFHLIDGKKLRCSIPLTTAEVDVIYKGIALKEGRVKFPTAIDTMQFLPVTSVLRVEVRGSSSDLLRRNTR